MAPREFDFDLRVDAGGNAGSLCDAVAAEIFRHLGYAADASAGFADAIRTAVGELCAGGRTCDVRFKSRAGELEVIVSAGPHDTRRVVCK